MSIIIKSVSGYKFNLVGNREGYAHSTGLAFYDTATDEWIAGNVSNGESTNFPYIPVGGRKALKQILSDSGDFFKLQPRVKNI